MPNSADDDIDGFFSTARVSSRPGAVELPADSHLNYVPDRSDPRVADARTMTYTEFADDRYQAPFLRELLAYWDSLYREPFVGITSNGAARAGLYALSPGPGPDAATTSTKLLDAARNALGRLDEGQRRQLCYPLDAPQWRAWSNPEFVVHRVGLRLEDLEQKTSDALLGIVRAALSPQGYQRVRRAMSLNAYLGDLIDLPNIMNERSYWMSIFGTPSADQPWGWQLFGHHVAVNFVSVAGRHVIAPVFLGAEPAVTDDTHPPLFAAREDAALKLASSLTAQQRGEAVVYESVLDPTMPAGRLHPADERTLAGAFRDNRVVPYEGITATSLSDGQQSLLRFLMEDALLLLTAPQRAATMADVEAHLDETRFAWYGATDGTQPFYFRIQSPVILTELDHHAGVWLNNRLPARFHVHTTLRLPNGNDYAHSYLDQWHERGTPPDTQ